MYSRNPASPLEEQIEGARRRVTQLQLKIQQETGGFVVSAAARLQEGRRAGGRGENEEGSLGRGLLSQAGPRLVSVQYLTKKQRAAILRSAPQG